MSALRPGAGAGQDRRPRRAGPRPRHVLARGGEIIAPLVPHYMGPCWFTLDPASLLVTSHYNEVMPRAARRSGWRTSTTRTTSTSWPTSRAPRGASRPSTRRPAATRAAARGGSQHARYGGDQELIARCARRAGDVWGVLSLYREPGAAAVQRRGDRRSCAPWRRRSPRAPGAALLVGEAADPEGPDAPGLLVLSSTGGRVGHARRRALARRAARTATGTRGTAAARGAGRGRPRAAHRRAAARRRARSRWRACSRGPAAGSCCTARRSSADGARRVAVIVEPAHPARIAPLLMAAYGLTEREQEVTRARAAGRLDRGDRRAPGGLGPHRPAAPQERLREDRASAAGATSSARCSSPTTSRACATTNRARRRAGRCAEGRSSSESARATLS